MRLPNHARLPIMAQSPCSPHEDDIEEATDEQGMIVRPGVIVPVGGGRVKMVANVIGRAHV